MDKEIVISMDSARTIAAAIRPQIKTYIEQNREKYEAWLKVELERECSNTMPYANEKDRRERNG